MVDPKDVSAVIVTRGNVDLSPVTESLIFSDIVVWDNSEKLKDVMTFGRIMGALAASHPVIFSCDDDIVHSPENQHRIVAEYQPGVLTGCMWPEWSQGAKEQGIANGYDDLVFMGSGSVFDVRTAIDAASRYEEHFRIDEFFYLWSDTIVGVIAPTKQLDIRFDALPEADADYRMANTAGFTEQKAEAIRRARWVRDLASVAA